MEAKERIHQAISDDTPDRVPVVPRISVDLAARFTGASPVDAIADPGVVPRLIAEALLARSWAKVKGEGVKCLDRLLAEEGLAE